MKKKSKGLFVTFEGGEGAGKTSFINRAFEELFAKGHDVIKTREPGGTPLGKKIRELLLHEKLTSISRHSELFLFLADRAQHVHNVILPALSSGKIVLCDRFNDSTIAYQGVARALDLPFLKELCTFATEQLCPDLTLYLDLDPTLGLIRAEKAGGHDRLEQEALHFHTKVRTAFLSLAKEEPHRFHVIDAEKSFDTVYLNGMKEIEAALCTL